MVGMDEFQQLQHDVWEWNNGMPVFFDQRFDDVLPACFRTRPGYVVVAHAGHALALQSM